MRLPIAIALAIITLVGPTLIGAMAAAHNTGASQPAFDHAARRPTFVEDFAHFAGSASGLVDGDPAWRTTFFGGDRTLPNNHEAEWYADPGPDGPFRVSIR